MLKTISPVRHRVFIHAITCGMKLATFLVQYQEGEALQPLAGKHDQEVKLRPSGDHVLEQRVYRDFLP